MRPIPFAIVGPALVLVQPAGATQYLTVAQAQQVIFPNQQLAPVGVVLTDAQASAIQYRSDTTVRHKALNLWRSPKGDWFLVDEVLGKHEYITYAVGLTAAGAVVDIEILEYRESYGGEIREAGWRGQFVGKTAAAPVKLEADIQNISGATLSSKHITDGVRRLLATWEVALKGR